MIRLNGRTRLDHAVSMLRICVVLGAVACAPACGERDGSLSEGVSAENATQAGAFQGSASCAECHERFYRLWAPSHHGLAMQPFSLELARERLIPQVEPLTVADATYQAIFDYVPGRVVERGPDGETVYPIAHALGGKNVFYFLTELERGRLQVLPVGFDLQAGEWFDTAASAMRHFSDASDEPLDWRHPAYTFNTSCHGCHVSQLATNYDLDTDSYRTAWVEPGINCETCHGPGDEHIRVCREAPEGQPPADLEIILTTAFDEQQMNDLCASCHAKARPLSTAYRPGDPFFDHFDLSTLEHQDYYPDGRDLGENYTHTTWLLSPCLKSETLDCMHCHTSSGRFRQKDDPNQACMPCHEDKVGDPATHSRHQAGGDGSRCISCHMPATWFARMKRHDHSMRPPRPAATLAFDSPNPCNDCHDDRDPAWADEVVRGWYGSDYAAAYLLPAELVDAARRQDWTRLPETSAYVASETRDAVYAASLIRLLRSCDDEATSEIFLEALTDPSPLVRASAAEALGERLSPGAVSALVGATRDDRRVVRVRAAAALAGVDARALDDDAQAAVAEATTEWIDSMRTRPDDAYSHYNLGNFRLYRGETELAIDAYRTAIRLRPDLVQPLVNLSNALAVAGDGRGAEEALERALELEPGNAAAHFNLGLILGEQGRLQEAVFAHRAALEADPKLAAAAYNLGVILAREDVNEGLRWCRRAAELRPREPKYAYTVAFFLEQAGDIDGAVETLERLIEDHPGYPDAWIMLGSEYERQGRGTEAGVLYRRAAENELLPPELRRQFAARIAQPADG
jgi:tetratricopeptide (TPR) repeat protein